MSDSPLAELSATPRKLAELVTRAGESKLDQAPAGEWSLRRVILHLLDDEMFDFRLRLERMLSEERPAFLDFPWGTGQGRDGDAISDLLRDFALQRQASIHLLTGLGAEDLRRSARMPGGRVLTVGGLVEAWVAHDREHIAQAERLAGSIGQSRNGERKPQV